MVSHIYNLVHFVYYITHSEISIIRRGGISLPLLNQWYSVQ